MANSKHVYTLIYPDGQEVDCRFGEVITILRKDFSLSASRDLIQKRIAKYKDRRIPAIELAAPARDRRQAAMVRWKKTGMETVKTFTGVETFSEPAATRQVWEKLVRDAGRRTPVQETIRRRLKAGGRTLVELLDTRPPGRPEAYRMKRKTMEKLPGEISPVRKNRPIPITAPKILHENMAIVKNSICEDVLPPMKTWSGPDKLYYRRQPL